VGKCEKLDAEWKILNTMYYGQESKPEMPEGKLPSLGYEDFLKGLELLLGGSGKEIGYEEAVGLYSRELYEESDAGKDGTVQQAIQHLNNKLESKRREAEKDLGVEEVRLRKEQEEARKNYTHWLEGEQEIKASDREELRELARRASDITLSVAEREAAAAAYEETIRGLRLSPEGLREELRERAQAAWGKGTWNSEWHYGELIKLSAPVEGLLHERIGYGRGSESYTEMTEEELASLTGRALDNAAGLERSIKETEWELTWRDYERQREAWVR
jgi:hypothetical protein